MSDENEILRMIRYALRHGLAFNDRVQDLSGSYDPHGTIGGRPGSIYRRSGSHAGLYVYEGGGWVRK